MKEIGLQPATSELGGKETRQCVHVIIPGGRYAEAYAKLKAMGFRLLWQSSKAKKARKTKFSCPQCCQHGMTHARRARFPAADSPRMTVRVRSGWQRAAPSNPDVTRGKIF